MGGYRPRPAQEGYFPAPPTLSQSPMCTSVLFLRYLLTLLKVLQYNHPIHSLFIYLFRRFQRLHTHPRHPSRRPKTQTAPLQPCTRRRAPRSVPATLYPHLFIQMCTPSAVPRVKSCRTGMLECACAPTHLYARVSVGPTGSAHIGRRNDTPPAQRNRPSLQVSSLS